MMTFSLAQAEAVAGKVIIESADFLAGKDAKWWFIAILLIFGFSTLLALRWLLAGHQKYVTGMETQLTEQRMAYAALNKQLFDYIVGDHLKSIDALNTMSASMRELAQAIKELQRRE